MALNAKLGFDGTSDETAWIWHNGNISNQPRYAVGGINEFKVSAGGSGDRAITITSGRATAKGMSVENTASINKNHSSVSSGTVYDLVVLRRDWENNALTIEIIRGSSSRAVPNRQVWAVAGQVDDQPLALVPVTAGQTSVGTPIDLRTWCPAGGLIVARDLLARDFFNDQVGAQVRVGGIVYTRAYDDATLTWEPDHTYLTSSSATLASGWSSSQLSFFRQDDMVTVYCGFTRTGATIAGNGNGNITNALMATIQDARFRPRNLGTLATYSAGPTLSGYVNNAGQITLAAMPPDFDFVKGYGPVALWGTYVAAPL